MKIAIFRGEKRGKEWGYHIFRRRKK